MRPIELILAILTILAAVITLLPKVSPKLKFQGVPGLLELTAIAQVWMEGFRWQLWPLMAGVLILAMSAGVRLRRGVSTQGSVWAAGLAILLAGVSLAGGWLLPVPSPFPTTGDYQVGTTVFPLADHSRRELYSEDINAPREIMVQVWYPAEPTANHVQADWMPDIQFSGPALSEWFELPSFTLNHLRYAKSNAFHNAPVAREAEGFPVLIFSHGWSGFREQNTYQVEELASHGYVVAAISHTYGAILTVFPDGRLIPKNEAALPDGVPQETYDRASNLLVRQWAGDIGFVLDELEQRAEEDGDWLLAGELNFDRVGVFGHSTGGGAAAEFCGTDQRCDALLAMDLWVEPVSGSVVNAGLSQPTLMLHSAAWADVGYRSENFAMLGDLSAASSGEVTEIRIDGTEHHDFSILPLLTPLAHTLGFKGPIEGDTGLALINYYSLAFFNQVLLGLDQGLLVEENAPYAEAQFISRTE